MIGSPRTTALVQTSYCKYIYSLVSHSTPLVLITNASVDISKQAGSYGSRLLKGSRIVFAPCGLICLCGAPESQAGRENGRVKAYCSCISSRLKEEGGCSTWMSE